MIITQCGRGCVDDGVWDNGRTDNYEDDEGKSK